VDYFPGLEGCAIGQVLHGRGREYERTTLYVIAADAGIHSHRLS
jgi:hypothetical protein